MCIIIANKSSTFYVFFLTWPPYGIMGFQSELKLRSLIFRVAYLYVNGRLFPKLTGIGQTNPKIVKLFQSIYRQKNIGIHNQ